MNNIEFSLLYFCMNKYSSPLNDNIKKIILLMMINLSKSVYRFSEWTAWVE